VLGVWAERSEQVFDKPEFDCNPEFNGYRAEFDEPDGANTASAAFTGTASCVTASGLWRAIV
jgi:hypothetical protein